MKNVAFLVMVAIGLCIVLMAVFPEETARLGVEAERSRSGLELKTHTVNAEPWHYLEGGPDDAEVVLLLHGFGGDKDNWTRFSADLTDKYRVIAPDLPGFGDSPRHPEWDYSLGPQRERLEGFVQSLGLQKFHVVGNSMGGHLSALYTHANPDQVLSVALFNNAGVKSPNESEMAQAVARGENPLVVHESEDFDELLDFVAYKKPFLPWPVKGVLVRKAVQNAEFNQFIYEAYKSDRFSGLEPRLAAIKQPALILWGEYDRVLDVSSVEVMKPLMPQAEVVIMQDTGHVPMIERPAETAGHYLAFLAKQ